MEPEDENNIIVIERFSLILLSNMNFCTKLLLIQYECFD